MSWYLILYIFAAIVIGTYPTMTLAQGGRTAAAITYFLLILAVLIFFGIRWFTYGGADDSAGAWPPIINACPDYLTYFKRPSSSDPSGFAPSCIDMLGVSRNGGISKWESHFSTDNPPSDDKYYFSLNTSATDSAKAQAQLCALAMDKGLTWEGITNGESCYSTSIATGAPGSGVASSCSS